MNAGGRSQALGAYRRIFAAPGAKGFAAAGFIARLPVAMMPIGIVTMLSQTHGSYALAGAVSAAFALGNALAAPQISRIVDRRGQLRIAGPATIVAIAGLLLLVAAAHLRWPIWTLFAGALMTAAMPSVPAMLRARWSGLFRDRPELGTAFAFESAADELVYISGASLSVALSVSLFAEAGPLIAAMLLAAGMAAFLAQRASEPAIIAATGARTGSAIRRRPVQVIALALVFVGVIFATTEVSVVALTKALGQPGAASPIVGVYAVGSFVVGLALGAMQPRMALHRQLQLALLALAVTQLPLLLAGSAVSLAFTVFLSGIAVSPTFITAFGLVAQRVPPHMLTEGVTWVFTAIGVGMAFGAFLAGTAIDQWGPRSGFVLCVIAGSAAFAVVMLGRTTLAEEPESKTA